MPRQGAIGTPSSNHQLRIVSSSQHHAQAHDRPVNDRRELFRRVHQQLLSMAERERAIVGKKEKKLRKVKETSLKSNNKPYRTKVKERTWSYHRKDRLEELGLHPDSALPRFAHGLPLTDLKKHDSLNEWHRHRQMLENKMISHKDLPPEFQTVKGKFRFASAKAKKKQAAYPGQVINSEAWQAYQVLGLGQAGPSTASTTVHPGQAMSPTPHGNLVNQARMSPPSPATSGGSETDWQMFRDDLDHPHSE